MILLIFPFPLPLRGDNPPIDVPAKEPIHARDAWGRERGYGYHVYRSNKGRGKGEVYIYQYLILDRYIYKKSGKLLISEAFPVSPRRFPSGREA
jgi:hypothetical protein